MSGFFTTDHSEAKNMFDPVKPGKYEAVITEAEVTTAATSGNPMIKVIYTIRSDVDQTHQKRKLFDNYVQSEKAMFKFQQAAKAIGLPQGTSVETLDDFAKLILFKAVKITVTNKKETYNGEERLKDNVSFLDVPTVPWSGGAGPTTDPFALPGGMPTEFPSDGDAPAFEMSEEDSIPPWERTSVEEAPAITDATKGRGRTKKKDQPDPFADDGKPIDISDDDLPF